MLAAGQPVSGSYLATARLPRAVQPMLNWLAVQTRESFSAVVLDGNEVVIVARSGFERKRTPDDRTPPAGMLLAYGLHLGARLPTHATSTGRVLLAAKPDGEVSDWLNTRSENGGLARLTLHTVTDPARLRQLIDQVRLDDYSVACEEHALDVLALAVPLRGMQGRTVAALNVVSSPQRMTAETLRRELLPLLRGAARELRPLL
ncbi:DNA-binding IclR family transcriptional regulator [Polaromonas sp. CG_9.11]|nr:DNA-binding IclR family transcriptional regulator [Polaromonas sp. CG_9.11]